MKILLNEIVEDVSNIEMINSYIYENMIVYINEYPHDIAHMNFEDVFYENIKEITKILIIFSMLKTKLLFNIGINRR